jgi:hypothetical protein
LQVNVTVTEFSENLSLTKPWALYALLVVDENPGGRSTTRCVGVVVGRQDAACNRKKCKHGRLCFFLPLNTQLRLRVAPPPLSRWRTGLRPERPQGA